jgi:Spy/CpxP family protein refolding chaperone
MGKLKISLYLAGIFVAGAASGVFGAFQMARRSMPTRETMASHWCGDLQSKLNLSADQVQKIRPMIDASLVQIQSNMSAAMLCNLSNCNMKIRCVLTPEQRARFIQVDREQREFVLTHFGNEPARPEK